MVGDAASWSGASLLRCLATTGASEVRRLGLRACKDIEGLRFTGEPDGLRAVEDRLVPGFGLTFELEVLDGLAAREDPNERAVFARDRPVLNVRWCPKVGLVTGGWVCGINVLPTSKTLWTHWCWCRLWRSDYDLHLTRTHEDTVAHLTREVPYSLHCPIVLSLWLI